MLSGQHGTATMGTLEDFSGYGDATAGTGLSQVADLMATFRAFDNHTLFFESYCFTCFAIYINDV
jgi:hypothetical protein